VPITASISPGQRAALTLVRWRVFLVADNWHVVAWCKEGKEGRVTSPIQKFDAARSLTLTRSGRMYHLSGPPGDDGDADYTWHRWQHALGIRETRDITLAVLRAIQGAAPGKTA